MAGQNLARSFLDKENQPVKTATCKGGATSRTTPGNSAQKQSFRPHSYLLDLLPERMDLVARVLLTRFAGRSHFRARTATAAARANRAAIIRTSREKKP